MIDLQGIVMIAATVSWGLFFGYFAWRTQQDRQKKEAEDQLKFRLKHEAMMGDVLEMKRRKAVAWTGKELP